MRAWGLLALGLAVGVGSAGCGGGGDSSTPDRRVIEIADSGPGAADAPTAPTIDAGPVFQEECDTTNQDCMDPDTPKCTVIFVGTAAETECLALTGSVAQDEVCVRTVEGNPGVGHDDCAAGLFCSGLGLPPGTPPPERRCRKFCDLNVNCPATQKCASLDGAMGPLEGICVPSCDLFSATCDAAGANMSCSISSNNDGLNGMGICRGNGAGAVGAGCMASTDCGANMNCLSSGVCAALCDTAHPCAAGTCTTVAGLPNMGGFCDPG